MGLLWVASALALGGTLVFVAFAAITNGTYLTPAQALRDAVWPAIAAACAAGGVAVAVICAVRTRKPAAVLVLTAATVLAIFYSCISLAMSIGMPLGG
jgi:hypothetical protein